jgi:RIO-like serine/threonine protein kinase
VVVRRKIDIVDFFYWTNVVYFDDYEAKRLYDDVLDGWEVELENGCRVRADIEPFNILIECPDAYEDWLETTIVVAKMERMWLEGRDEEDEGG